MWDFPTQIKIKNMTQILRGDVTETPVTFVKLLILFGNLYLCRYSRSSVTALNSDPPFNSSAVLFSRLNIDRSVTLLQLSFHPSIRSPLALTACLVENPLSRSVFRHAKLLYISPPPHVYD